MGALSTVYDNHTLDSMLGDAHATAFPATVYVALSSTLPAKDGTNVTEPVGNGYARVSVANTTANWSAASAGSKSNATVIAFPQATGTWGTEAYWVIFDAATAGTMIAFGALQTAVSVTSGVTPDFPVGALVLAAD